MRRVVPTMLALLALAAPVFAQEGSAPPPPEPKKAPWTKKLFFGGSAGLGFGDVDYVSLAPMVGYHVVPRFDVGVQPFYTYANYKLYDPDVKTHNYGIDLFARFRVFRGFFIEGQYEWIDYEYILSDLSKGRRSDSYWYGGAGYAIGAGRVGVYVTALYNFSYRSDDPFRAYDSPWSVQVGVGVGF